MTAEKEDRKGDNPPAPDVDRREYIRVLIECPAIYRVIDPHEAHKKAGSRINSIYHMPPLPSFDWAERLYKNADQTKMLLRR